MDDGVVNLTKEVEGRLGRRKTTPPTDGSVRTANEVLTDYYRCPPNILQFLPALLSDKRRGFFFLARTPSLRAPMMPMPRQSGGQLDDALEHVKVEAPEIRLPFDASGVIENLRRERYSAHFREEGSALNALLRKAYYLLRPFLLVPVRRIFKRYI